MIGYVCRFIFTGWCLLLMVLGKKLEDRNERAEFEAHSMPAERERFPDPDRAMRVQNVFKAMGGGNAS